VTMAQNNEASLAQQAQLRGKGVMPPRDLPPSLPPVIKAGPSEGPGYPVGTKLYATANGVQVPRGKSPQTQQLGAHITHAADAYARGDYRAAHEMLASPRAAKAHGRQLAMTNVYLDEPVAKATVQKTLAEAQLAGVSYDGSKTMKFTDIGFRPADGNLLHGQPLWSKPSVAKQLLPIQLEEWMHQHQGALKADGINDGFISKLTPEFARDRPGRANMGEVDILASFIDWKFPVDKLKTREAYPERQEFYLWAQQKKYV
jgi:hypothetical protein